MIGQPLQCEDGSTTRPFGGRRGRGGEWTKDEEPCRRRRSNRNVLLVEVISAPRQMNCASRQLFSVLDRPSPPSSAGPTLSFMVGRRRSVPRQPGAYTAAHCVAATAADGY